MWWPHRHPYDETWWSAHTGDNDAPPARWSTLTLLDEPQTTLEEKFREKGRAIQIVHGHLDDPALHRRALRVVFFGYRGHVEQLDASEALAVHVQCNVTRPGLGVRRDGELNTGRCPTGLSC